jgi:hypothetical protein
VNMELEVISYCNLNELSMKMTVFTVFFEFAGSDAFSS